MNLEDHIVCVPDFPRPGILFRDVTGILESHEAFCHSIDCLLNELKGIEFDKIAGVESRGFIFGAPLACRAGVGFVPVRKAGKLPRAVVHQEYDLEYGKAALELHADAITPGQRVVVVDDLLATGGTVEASCKLIERLGGKVVKILFVVELEGLPGREKLKNYDVSSLLTLPGE